MHSFGVDLAGTLLNGDDCNTNARLTENTPYFDDDSYIFDLLNLEGNLLLYRV